MPHYLIQFEALFLLQDKVILVAIEHLPLDSPMVIYPIRIEKVDAPTLSLRRKAAQKQDLCPLWKERFQWVIFHSALASSYVFCV